MLLTFQHGTYLISNINQIYHIIDYRLYQVKNLNYVTLDYLEHHHLVGQNRTEHLQVNQTYKVNNYQPSLDGNLRILFKKHFLAIGVLYQGSDEISGYIHGHKDEALNGPLEAERMVLQAKRSLEQTGIIIIASRILDQQQHFGKVFHTCRKYIASILSRCI